MWVSSEGVSEGVISSVSSDNVEEDPKFSDILWQQRVLTSVKTILTY